ncbi:MAG: extracellular solute-binding protein [Nitrincola lacisaponensis]|uniref:ABC transporter, periplasmic substrate-binding protein n=1 Tax=Nitrincola lacisaponensis TaxID=267850 RepID=A0A063Y0Z5_9GAMM|nr:extracellular solute-binding protein [Nitrincola lacisaponensis]KDE39364.1 ABC transporter, periplasmic substrate-binding protein [Nitrincola lacisaponensis]
MIKGLQHFTRITASIVLISFSTWSMADPEYTHGIAMHGDLKYPADFTHFDYVNPDAPKGGRVVQSSIGSFDSFNPFIVKGTPADGLGLLYDSLTSKSDDEPFSVYGLLAKRIRLPDDRRWVEFEMRPEARFSDGKPVTAEDVINTFRLLREKGSPFYRAYYADIVDIQALGPHRVRFEFAETENRELALIVGEVPILPKHYWETRDFEESSLDIPIGSGPYILSSYNPGRSVTYRRNPDYWGVNLPVRKGRYNFDEWVFDYYRDGTVALEAFKAGQYDYRTEHSAKNWATGYTGSALNQGRIIMEQIEHQNPVGMQAFVMNTRRSLFSDPQVRHALAHAFDFEWTNRAIFYDAYKRSHSFFSNSEMAAEALPDDAELAILEPIRHLLPEQVFTEVYRAPQTDGDGNIRTQIREGLHLLADSGWTLERGVLRNEQGQPFRFEILIIQRDLERLIAPFIRNLERMGIQAQIRVVDISQYINRLREYDFDMIITSYGQSNSPGNEQREYWHSSSAERPGSRNLIGIRNPAVDHLVEQLIQAPDREQLVLRARALDRALQWHHYVIPHYHTNSYRIAYWDKFGIPETRPKYAIGFDTWWIKR